MYCIEFHKADGEITIHKTNGRITEFGSLDAADFHIEKNGLYDLAGIMDAEIKIELLDDPNCEPPENFYTVEKLTSN